MAATPERAREIVQQILYVTVASVSSEGKPWNSPVFSSFDDAGNFYWVSAPESQHSRNVEANGNAFLVIYDSTVPWGTGEGVYIEAQVDVLTDLHDIAEARRHMSLRVGKPLDEHPERFLDGGIRRAYRATPLRVWMNDDDTDEHGNYVRDTRVELPLAALHGMVRW